MIHIRDDLYLLPEKLMLIKGDFEKERISEQFLDSFYPDFKEHENPKEMMSRIQNVEKVNYEYCFPITGGICVSEKCQLRCNYCAFDSKEKGLSIVDMEKVKPFVDFLISNLIMRRINNSNEEILDLYLAGGGEPTYDWEIVVKIVEYVKAKCSKHNIKYTFGITTNCILSGHQLEYLKNNFNLITVSFDGLPYLQNKNRRFSNGRGTFDAVNYSLNYFSENDVPIVMRSTIWPEDYDKLLDIVKFVFEKYPNVGVLDVEPINNRGRAAKSKFSTICKDFVDYFIKAKRYLEGKGFAERLVCGKFKDNITSFVCGTSYGKNPWLLPNGDMVTCLDAKEKATVVAKVINGKINKNIFTDQLLETYLENQKVCRNCYAWHFCGGGCPLRYVNADEEKNNNDECLMIRKYWEYIFDKLIEGEKIFGWESIPVKIENSNLIVKRIWRQSWKLK